MDQYTFDRKAQQIINKLTQAKNMAPLALVLIIVLALLSSFYTVEPDEEAIVLRFGKHVGTTPPGLHLKFPFGIDSVEKVKTKQILQQEFGFRTRGSRSDSRSSYSNKDFNAESLMLTGDLNVADVEWVIQFQISDPYKYLYKTRDPVTNIRDVSQAVMRRVVGDKLFTDVITEGRTVIVSEAKSLTQEILNQYDMGITIVSIQLQGVTPPEEVKTSFNEFNAATQEREKMINQAEKVYNKIIPEARGKAEKEITIAQGYAKAIINRAEGDAQKFQLVLAEYKKAPRSTRTRLYLETMEKLFQRFEDVMIVDSSIKGLMPIVNGQLKGESGK